MQIARTWNPLTLSRDARFLKIGEARTPNGILAEHELIFVRPFILLVNGEPWLRARWSEELPADAVCHFVELPHGGEGGSNIGQILATIVVMVAAAYSGGAAAAAWGPMAGALVQGVVMIGGMYLVNQFFAPSTPSMSAADIEAADPSYSLTAGRNTARPGQPIPEHFGRHICFPALIMDSYTEFVDHEQYFYMIGLIGVGEYDVESVRINKTPIGDYAEATYNILPPGATPSLCPNLVWTCKETGSQELSTEWLTVIVSAVGTTAHYLAFDFIYSSGLVGYNDRGNAYSVSVTVEAQARLVDDDDAATTDWETILYQTHSAATRTPRRYTHKVAAIHGPGRYEVRVRRTTEASDNGKETDRVVISAIRAYGPAHPDYGDLTLFEARIKATDKLNGDSATRISAIPTRKLYPVTSTGLGTTLTATRSPVDAAAYVVTAANGGRQPESILDFESLAPLRSTLVNRGNHFDHRFTSRQSVMDACVKIARCGRAVPIMPGGLFTMVRDEIQALPAQVYTDDDFSQDSLELTHALRTADNPTCVEVQYTDPDSWETESVYCLDLGGSVENPAVLRLIGCTSRQHAWEEGMYMYADDLLNRTAVAFPTGLKGYIPRIGNKIVVSATMIDWGQCGMIAAIDGVNIWLSEPVDFAGSDSGYLYVVGGDGELTGPYAVSPTDYAHCVQGSLSGSNPPKTIQEDGAAAGRYIFGAELEDLLQIRVTRIRPQSQNEIRIEGSIINEDVYSADEGTAPAKGCTYPALDPLDSVTISYQGKSGDLHQFYATWIGSATEFQVEVDEGGGYATAADPLDAYGYVFTTAALSVDVRVTPYINEELGTPQTAGYDLPATPASFTHSSSETEKGILFSWSAVSGADSYEVGIWYDGGNKGMERVTETSHRLYATDVQAIMGEEHPPPWNGEELTVKVRAIKGNDHSDWAETEVDLTVPGTQHELDFGTIGETTFTITWLNWSGPVDGAVVLSGPHCDDPAASNQYVYVKTTAGYTTEGYATSVPYADCWEGANHEDTGWPYSVCVAAFYDNLKALDFLLWGWRRVLHEPM